MIVAAAQAPSYSSSELHQLRPNTRLMLEFLAPALDNAAVDQRTSRMDLIERFPAGKAWATEESLAVARMVQRWTDRELIARRQTLRESYDELLLPAYTALTLELGLQRYLWPAGGEEAPDPVEAAMTLTLATEQVGRGDVGLAWLLAGLLAPSAALTLGPDAATAEVRAALEPLLAGGPQRPRIVALVPPVLDLGNDDDAPRFDGRRLQATARRDGEGWIVTAAAARPLAAGGTATLFALLCHVEGPLSSRGPNEEAGAASPAWALIPADAEGVRRGEPILQAGLTASRNAPVTLDRVRAPAAALTLAGTTACQSLLSWHDLLAAAACVGALAAGHEILADWGDNRVIKGKGQLFKNNPLCAGQMADLSQRIALCRPLVLDLAHRLARQDLYGPAGGAAQRLQAQAVAHHVAASAMAGLDHAMELMGSAGYATEWNLERHWRDVKTVQVQLGSGVLGRVAAARHHYDARVILNRDQETALRSIDDITRPLEYLSPMDKHLGAIVRAWADREVIPHRRRYDEDWKDHALIEPAFDKLMGELGLQRVLFPEQLGGWGLGHSGYLGTASFRMFEEVARADSGMAVAFGVTFWPLVMICVEPHVNTAPVPRSWPRASATRQRAVLRGQRDDRAPGRRRHREPRPAGGQHHPTTAVLDGDTWVINGHKLWPTNTGGVAELFGVVCTTRAGLERPRRTSPSSSSPPTPPG